MTERFRFTLMMVAYCLLLLRLSGVSAGAVPLKENKPLTRAMVIQAINRGVHYLLKEKKPRKFWETLPPGSQNSGGPTALALYALLQVGNTLDRSDLSVDSPQLNPAVRWLEKLTPKSTYVAALQISALTESPSNSPLYFRALARADKYLVDAQHSDGAYHYVWNGGKPNAVRPGDWDNSNSQYGLLGVWAAALAGFTPPDMYWIRCEKHWRKWQNEDGGWSYQGHGGSTRAMTVAGVASLYVVDQYRHTGVHLNPHEDKNIQNALHWLQRHIYTQNNMYYLYGLERVGLAGGLRHIGKVNWYRMGAATIIKDQDAANGAWNGYVLAQPSDVVPTAYALLFLTRGLNPVVFNKLQYAGPWNARPRDDYNVTQWLSSTFEAPLNWQSVNIASNPRTWLDAPILLITGHGNPHFTSADIAKFKWFMNHGGLIFSNADGNSQSFTHAMERAASAAAGKAWKMRPLSPSNWLYHVQYPLPARMDLMGLSNGIRVSWVHSPKDVAAQWETLSDYWHPHAFQLAANVYFYATSKHRLVRHLNPGAPTIISTGKPRLVNVALVRHHGPWNPEPEAFHDFEAYAAMHDLKLSLHTATLDTLGEKPLRIGYMLALKSFDPSWETEHNLRNFLNTGGTLIIEAPTASPAVYHSVQSLIAQLYPLAIMQRIAMSSRIFSGRIPHSVALPHAQYRAFFLRHHGYLHKPVLYGLRRHGRWMIVFSPYNIATGLTGSHAWGVLGYSPHTANPLLLDMLLYAAPPRRP
ncbi:MAG: DUF4159 domain-containing protein [Phycisphaerae bacterium]